MDQYEYDKTDREMLEKCNKELPKKQWWIALDLYNYDILSIQNSEQDLLEEVKHVTGGEKISTLRIYRAEEISYRFTPEHGAVLETEEDCR